MERKENKKLIAIVKDPWKGSYAFRGVVGEKEALKNVEALKKRGVPERNISLIPVKEPRMDKIGRALSIIGIACTFIDFGLYIKKEIMKKKRKSESKKVLD